MRKSPHNRNQSTASDRAFFLDALANTSRLRVLEVLIEEGVSVGRLVEMLGISQSALSQHLRRLRAAGLVTTRRKAQKIYYSSSSASARMAFDLLHQLFDTGLANNVDPISSKLDRNIRQERLDAY